MSITNEKIISAIEYIVESPFVQKVVEISDEEDLKYADAIHKVSAKLASVKQEHKIALDVVKEAAKEPEKYFKIIQENSEKTRTECSDAYDKAKKEFEDIPKVDEKYVCVCTNEIKKLEKERQQTTQATKNEIEEEEKKRKIYRNVGISLIIILIVWLPFFFAFLDIVPSGALDIYGIVSLIYVAITPICSYIFFKKSGTAEYYQQTLNNKMLKNNQRIYEAIELLYQKIGHGFEDGSKFDMNRRQLEIYMLKAGEKFYRNEAKHLSRIDLSKDGFEQAIFALENVILNFDSLNNWASDYLQEYRQKQYNEKLYAVEIEKLKEQKAASDAQQYAIQRQNELLEKQARAAAAAQQTAENLARDTEEIRRRMFNAGYGEYYNPDRGL